MVNEMLLPPNSQSIADAFTLHLPDGWFCWSKQIARSSWSTGCEDLSYFLTFLIRYISGAQRHCDAGGRWLISHNRESHLSSCVTGAVYHLPHRSVPFAACNGSNLFPHLEAQKIERRLEYCWCWYLLWFKPSTLRFYILFACLTVLSASPYHAAMNWIIQRYPSPELASFASTHVACVMHVELLASKRPCAHHLHHITIP